MHVVVELMNAWLVHRHLLSVDEQPARSADAMHVKAHSMGVVQSIYMLVNVSMKERTRHGLAGDKGGGGSAGESEGSEEAHLGLCSVIKGSLRERMRTATTTKDERRGGLRKEKEWCHGFISLPLRSQDHLIITFPTQLYLGREFDVSIRIEIGMIPIRTTLAHTANIMGPALFWAFPSCTLPWNIGMGALYYNQTSLSFITLLSTLIIPSSRTKALVLPSPDRRR